MPGFIPCEADLARLKKYEQRRRTEQRNRAAIRDGQKVYDNH